jgi:hypothetical protein
MHWPEVGAAYRRLFERVSRHEPAKGPVAIPVGSVALARA